jgi:hypothetical protein
MAKESEAPGGLTPALKAIVTVTREAFKGLPPIQKLSVAFAAFFAIILLSLSVILGIVGKLPPWAIVLLFIAFLFFLVGVVLVLIRSESRKRIPSACRHVPIYPLTDDALTKLSAVLAAIRVQAHKVIAQKLPEFALASIRANIFLLARTETNNYKLVITLNYV